MPVVRANGIDIEIRLDCPTDGLPVILSNSLSTDHRMWDDQLPALADKYRVIRWNKRGHGGSEATLPPYDLAEDVCCLMNVLGIERAHYVGLSTGGAIGQYLAATQPGRVDALVLCDTSSYVPAEVWDSRMAVARREGMEGVARASIERWFTPAFRQARPDVVAKFHAMIVNTELPGYIGCASALKQRMLGPLLGKISAPTLVVVGAEDPSTPVAHSEVIQRGIAGAELAVIDDAAHISNAAQPEEFNRLLRMFLDRH